MDFPFSIFLTKVLFFRVENKLMVTGGRDGGMGGIDREFGIDMYTLLYLK